MSVIAKHIFVSGRVQGVGYRNFVFSEACTHNLKGWVRNLTDGRVEIVVQGEESKVMEFSEHLHKGPLMAVVAGVEAKDIEVDEEADPHFLVVDSSEKEWRPGA